MAEPKDTSQAASTAESNEKAVPLTPEQVDKVGGKTVELDLDQYGEENGYVVDAERLKSIAGEASIKLAKDGKTVLIPQPSDDPNDPLNWSWGKKHAILAVITITSFLPDYGSATGAVTLIPQAMEWNMPQDTVNHSQAGNVFMVGAGGVITVMLSAYFGRAPILFWFSVMGLWTAIWCTAATNFETFMAARVINGFFSTVAQGVSFDFYY